MVRTTHFIAVPFSAGPDGELMAGEPIEARSPSGALFLAKTIASNVGGAVAFSRSGDAQLGEYDDAVLLAREGVTPDDLVAYVRPEVRPTRLSRDEEKAVDAALTKFGGDARKAIAALLHDLDALAADARSLMARGAVLGGEISQRRKPRRRQ